MKPIVRNTITGITHCGDVCIGDILMDVDGYYKWWPKDTRGYLNEEFLFHIARYLHALNAEWDAQVQKDLAS